ncbi:anti-sigma factor antagonist [candidate division KSB1 bacterium]|nr:MAG: anti-sigma factor antagonist [candidate division KSB1 bacterium]
MAIKEKIEGDVAVLTLKGNLMGGPETQDLREHIYSLIGDGIKKVVIDLGKVKWMNSVGLGALMAALTSMRNKGGNLKLANVTKKVQSLLMITQLMNIFETFETVDRAVASYKNE